MVEQVILDTSILSKEQIEILELIIKDINEYNKIQKLYWQIINKML